MLPLRNPNLRTDKCYLRMQLSDHIHKVPFDQIPTIFNQQIQIYSKIYDPYMYNIGKL